MNKHRISRVLLISTDWLAAVMAWSIFYQSRKLIEEGSYSFFTAFNDIRYWQALIIIPFLWVVGFMLIGSYRNVVFKTRIGLLQEVVIGCFFGALGLLLFVLGDDIVLDFRSVFWLFGTVWLIHVMFFSLFRICVVQIFIASSATQFWSYKASVIGSVDDSLGTKYKIGSAFLHLEEYLTQNADNIDVLILSKDLIGELDKLLPHILGTYKGYVILIHEALLNDIKQDYHAIPSIQDAYVRIFNDPISSWEFCLKRFGDIVVSIFCCIFLSPLYLWIAYNVKQSSSGPLIYKQKRLGIHGKEFDILKFRSMYTNAEEKGPCLTSKNDDRCTPFGKWLRRWRLDELPQFWNVLKGDMSIVGPRPERRFYASQLMKRESAYPLLWRTKPGITSWGQIKFGYAASIDEMLRRFRYDLLYVDRMGPFFDLRIIWYTLIVLFQGRGR